ncbi:MAG: hypothetical protein ACR2J3_02755 [Aridibacter sp.]
MKKFLFLFFVVLLFSTQILNAQETFFQTGHTHDILEVHFSPDDSQLISYSAADGWLILWDVKSGRQIWKTETGFIRKTDEGINLKEFYWSEDGKSIVTKSINGTYQKWSVETGKILDLSEVKPSVNLIQPKPKVVSANKNVDTFAITNSKSGKTFKLDSISIGGRAFDISYDGTLFAEGKGWGDASIKITNLETGKFYYLDGHPSMIKSIAFSPDGKTLAVAGTDKNIYVFDVQKQLLLKILAGHQRPIDKIVFSPDGTKLVSTAEMENLKIWDWQAGKILAETKQDLWHKSKIIDFSSDGKYLLTNSNLTSFEIWNAQTLEVVQKFKTAEKYEETSGNMGTEYDAVPVYSAEFSKNGKEIIANYADGKIRVWSLNQDKPIRILEYAEKGCSVEFTFDGKSFLTVCGGGDKLKIRLRDAETGVEIKQFDDNEAAYIQSVKLNPNGKNFVSSDISSDIFLWNLSETKPIKKFDIGFSGNDAIAFSPDGKTFAIGGRNQNLFLFDVETGAKIWQLIPSYQQSDLEKKLEQEYEQRRKTDNERKSVTTAEREKQSKIYIEKFGNKITAKFSHYGDAESFWDQMTVESGIRNKSKLKLPREKASVAWFTLTNDSDLPISIETNSDIFNPKCKGLCNGAEISSRYVIELKNGEVNVNGYDVVSITILPPKTTVYFSVLLHHFAESKAIYLGFTFQKDNADNERSNYYGTEQKLYVREADLPK